MEWQEVVLVIVVVAILAKVLRAKFNAEAGYMTDHRGNPLAVPGADTLRENEAMRRELEALRERVKVLERIATDGARPNALAAEIEALRETGER